MNQTITPLSDRINGADIGLVSGAGIATVTMLACVAIRDWWIGRKAKTIQHTANKEQKKPIHQIEPATQGLTSSVTEPITYSVMQPNGEGVEQPTNHNIEINQDVEIHKEDMMNALENDDSRAPKGQRDIQPGITLSSLVHQDDKGKAIQAYVMMDQDTQTNAIDIETTFDYCGEEPDVEELTCDMGKSEMNNPAQPIGQIVEEPPNDKIGINQNIELHEEDMANESEDDDSQAPAQQCDIQHSTDPATPIDEDYEKKAMRVCVMVDQDTQTDDIAIQTTMESPREESTVEDVAVSAKLEGTERKSIKKQPDSGKDIVQTEIGKNPIEGPVLQKKMFGMRHRIPISPPDGEPRRKIPAHDEPPPITRKRNSKLVPLQMPQLIKLREAGYNSEEVWETLSSQRKAQSPYKHTREASVANANQLRARIRQLDTKIAARTRPRRNSMPMTLEDARPTLPHYKVTLPVPFSKLCADYRNSSFFLNRKSRTQNVQAVLYKQSAQRKAKSGMTSLNRPDVN